MNRTTTFALAAGLGAVAGMRSMAAPALLSRQLSRLRRRRKSRGVARLLRSQGATGVLAILAFGEMMADKTPFVPDRTDVPSVLGRMASGAFCGAAIAGWRRDPAVAAAAVGAAAAVASTFAAYHLRRTAGQATGAPDPLLGVAEDAVTLLAGSRLAAAVR